MKLHLLIILTLFYATSTFGQTVSVLPKKTVTQAEEKADRKHLIGAKGGCCRVNSSGNKTYVDRNKRSQM